MTIEVKKIRHIDEMQRHVWILITEARLCILKWGKNYKSEQWLLDIDQLNYEYFSEFVHFCNFHLISRYTIDLLHALWSCVLVTTILDLNFNPYKNVIFFNIIIHNFSFTYILCLTNKLSALQINSLLYTDSTMSRWLVVINLIGKVDQ